MTSQEVQFVTVECGGYATVKFDTSTTECSTEIGNGSIVHTFPSGNYDIYHHDGTHLQINHDGDTRLHPRPNNDLELLDPNHKLQYRLTHFDEVIIETTDNDGNIFSVHNTGETSVIKADGTKVGIDEEGLEKLDGEVENINKKNVVTYKQHAPRFFILHSDGSGTELLRYQDVSEYLADAEDDLATAILMDPLADHPGVLGITILKPYVENVSQKWLTRYSMNTIIPPGLTSRDLKTLPAQEFKTEGPVFGTNVGQGMTIGSVVKPQPRPPVLRCPSQLELRQIIQYRPVSDQLRDRYV